MLRKHILTDQGRVLLIEDASEHDTRQVAQRFYENIGGAEFFERLTSAFYQHVMADEVLAPLFKGNPAHHAERLARHYNRMYGKPDLTEGWDERFLRSHLQAVISNEHRERWLNAMRRAGTEAQAPEPWFSDFMTTMIDASRAVAAVSRGAALARGLHLDRAGRVVDAPPAEPPA